MGNERATIPVPESEGGTGKTAPHGPIKCSGRYLYFVYNPTNQEDLMRKIILCLSVIALLASSCLKKEGGCPYSDRDIVAPATEVTAIENYLASQNITTATKHSSGMY